MNKIYLLAIILFATACHKDHKETQQEKAQRLVDEYAKTTLTDPGTYTSVKFSKLYKLKDTVIFVDGKADTIRYNGRYAIIHTYRFKGLSGDSVTRTYWYQIDSLQTKAMCCFRAPINTYP